MIIMWIYVIVGILVSGVFLGVSAESRNGTGIQELSTCILCGIFWPVALTALVVIHYIQKAKKVDE